MIHGIQTSEVCHTQIAATHQKVVQFLDNAPWKEKIVCVLLGGSYGRGDGGVYRDDSGNEHLYNDMDYFVLTHPLSASEFALVDPPFRALEKVLSADTQVDVEFGPLTPVDKLPELAHTLMWNELFAGYQFVWGDESYLTRQLWCDAAHLPIAEGHRLALNRAMGVFLSAPKIAKSRADFTHDDACFVARNLNKAILGLCDAHLILTHHYDYVLDERLKRLQTFFPALAPHYARAIQFKLSPVMKSYDELQAQWATDFPWIVQQMESIRAQLYPGMGGASKASVFFQKPSPCLGALSWKESIKNFLRNLRSGLFLGVRFIFRHPREQIYLKMFNILLEKGTSGVYINMTSAQYTLLVKLWQKYN